MPALSHNCECGFWPLFNEDKREDKGTREIPATQILVECCVNSVNMRVSGKQQNWQPAKHAESVNMRVSGNQQN